MMSRRLLLRALGLSGAAAVSGGTPIASAPLELEIEGCVSWCNWPRGYLKFRPLRSDAAERLIMLAVADDAILERLQQRGPCNRLSFGWHGRRHPGAVAGG